MYGFLIGVGVLLLLSIIWMVYRIQTLVSVVKGSDKKIATGSNKVNAILFVLFLVGTTILMFWYSIKEFDNYQLPVASEHGVITDKLFWITMAVTGVVFLITHVLLFIFPYKYQDWTSNHVWLHKQPLPLWSMSASLWMFGINEIAVRLPARRNFSASSVAARTGASP